MKPRPCSITLSHIIACHLKAEWNLLCKRYSYWPSPPRIQKSKEILWDWNLVCPGECFSNTLLNTNLLLVLHWKTSSQFSRENDNGKYCKLTYKSHGCIWSFCKTNCYQKYWTNDVYSGEHDFLIQSDALGIRTQLGLYPTNSMTKSL